MSRPPSSKGAWRDRGAVAENCREGKGEVRSEGPRSGAGLIADERKKVEAEATGGGLRLELFPNPAHPDVPATLFAEGLPAAEVAGTVRDAFGRIVRRFSAPVVNGRIQQELDMRGLPAGEYFVELVSEKGVVLGSGKLVVGMR